MNNCRIIIFAKAPIPGKVKTRLIVALGEQNSALLAQMMLLDTLDKAIKSGAETIELRTEPSIDNQEWAAFDLPKGLIINPQGAGDLGVKMARAAQSAINEGKSAILIGTDCPELSELFLGEIINDLTKNDIVIVPAFDGGYVVLAMNNYSPSLFEGIEWGASEVAAKTIAKINALGLKLLIKPKHRDIDTKDDLQFLPAKWKEILFDF